MVGLVVTVVRWAISPVSPVQFVVWVVPIGVIMNIPPSMSNDVLIATGSRCYFASILITITWYLGM